VYSGSDETDALSRTRAPRFDESSESGSRGAGRETGIGTGAAGGDRPKMAAEAAGVVDLFVPYFRRGGMRGEEGGGVLNKKSSG
jgi:hypothetical protein